MLEEDNKSANVGNIGGGHRERWILRKDTESGELEEDIKSSEYWRRTPREVDIGEGHQEW